MERVSCELGESGIRVRGQVREGVIPDEIIAGVERVGADLIVMPMHGGVGLVRAVLGSSIAQQVLERRPVLILLAAPSAHPRG